MKVAVVGNGTSANGCGAEIDACDFVVRINCWKSTGPLDAGVKVNAVCGNSHWIEFPDGDNWELWSNIPVEFALFPPGEHPLDVEYMVKLYGPFKALRFAPLNSNTWAVGRIRSYSAWKDKLSFVSAGLSTIIAAADILKPREVHIFGFDFIDCDKSKIYSRDKSARCMGACDKHDWAAEKKVIADLVDYSNIRPEGIRRDTFFIWHGRPEGI